VSHIAHPRPSGQANRHGPGAEQHITLAVALLVMRTLLLRAVRTLVAVEVYVYVLVPLLKGSTPRLTVWFVCAPGSVLYVSVLVVLCGHARGQGKPRLPLIIVAYRPVATDQALALTPTRVAVYASSAHPWPYARARSVRVNDRRQMVAPTVATVCVCSKPISRPARHVPWGHGY
jgi:hypothetical protein